LIVVVAHALIVIIARLEALGHHITLHHTLTDVTGHGPLPPAQLRTIHVLAAVKT
jgi:hypothetical protein